MMNTSYIYCTYICAIPEYVLIGPTIWIATRSRCMSPTSLLVSLIQICVCTSKVSCITLRIWPLCVASFRKGWCAQWFSSLIEMRATENWVIKHPTTSTTTTSTCNVRCACLTYFACVCGIFEWVGRTRSRMNAAWTYIIALICPPCAYLPLQPPISSAASHRKYILL